jgi:hypothetical protein
MHIYVLSDADRVEIARVVDHATKPEAIYVAVRPGDPQPKPPGDCPEYVAICKDSGLRCVFTITDFGAMSEEVGGRYFRHLSVSGRDGHELPHRLAVELVLPLFGFKGSAEEVFAGAAEYGSYQIVAAVVLIEPYEPAVH